MRFHGNSVFNTSHSTRKVPFFFTRFSVGLSHLNKNKFKQNPICNWGVNTETLNQFFLHKPMKDRTFCIKLKSIILVTITDGNRSSITSILSHDSPIFSAELNTNILDSYIDYILFTKRFRTTLFLQRPDP